MKSDYATKYRDLYRHHWWWRARERLLIETLRRICPPDGFGRILDVGCGDGLFFEGLRAFGDPEGVEPDAELISDWGLSRGPIHVGELDSRFDPDYRFGLITMLDVIEHISRPVEVLERARDLLAPGGRLLLTVPAFRCLWTSHDDHNEHVTRFTRSRLRKVTSEAGFTELSCHYFFHWLVLAKLLVRAREALLGASRPASIPSSSVNRVLFEISNLELRLPSYFRPPVGSSLLYLSTRR